MKEFDEALNKTAANFAVMIKEGALDRVLFTSAVDGEGTTTVMLQVANKLNNLHAIKPLVVELSWRKPSFARIFRVDPEHCLLSFAAGECSARECVHETESGLAVVPFSAKPLSFGSSDIASLLSRLLDEVAGDYDCVFVDCASLIGQSDTLLVSKVVPRVVLVVESGRTRAEVVRRARRELEERGIQIAGAILNKQRRWIPKWIYRLLVT